MSDQTREGSPRRLRMGTICTIDDEGVLILKRAASLESLKGHVPKSGEIVFDHVVDTPVNRYKWTGKTFQAISVDPTDRLQANPDLLGFLMKIAEEIIIASRDPNNSFQISEPVNANRIIEWYKRSFDGRG